MKILLLGGTGTMGVHLADELSKRGYELFITTRTKKEPTSNITYLQGNAHDLDFLKEVLHLQVWDCVVDFMIYSTLEFLDRVDLLLGKCKHYVFLSTACVYANSKTPLREDSPRLLDVSLDKEYLSSDEYALTKARQENILAKSGFKHYTIVRPYITFSTYRLPLGILELDSWLYRTLQGKSIVFFKEIAEHYTTMTYGLDVAKALSCIVCNPKTHAQSYHIANDFPVRWEEILKIYLKILQKELGREVRVVFANLYEFFGKHNYQVIYDRLFDRKFDNSKINALLAESGEKQFDYGGGGG